MELWNAKNIHKSKTKVVRCLLGLHLCYYLKQLDSFRKNTSISVVIIILYGIQYLSGKIRFIYLSHIHATWHLK